MVVLVEKRQNICQTRLNQNNRITFRCFKVSVGENGNYFGRFWPIWLVDSGNHRNWRTEYYIKRISASKRPLHQLPCPVVAVSQFAFKLELEI
jgi:hypothetical protein